MPSSRQTHSGGEDDAILAINMKQNLNTILEKGVRTSFYFLDEPDSFLQAEIEPSLGPISLFEPAYPKEEELKQLVNSRAKRRVCKQTLLWPSRISNNTGDSKVFAKRTKTTYKRDNYNGQRNSNSLQRNPRRRTQYAIRENMRKNYVSAPSLGTK